VQRISLRTWILLPAWALVTGLILTLSLSQADTLVSAWLKSSVDIAELAGQQVKQTLLRRLAESTPRSTSSAARVSDARSRWSAFVQTDPGIESMLQGIAGRGGAIVEISIADQQGRVLTSSYRARAGKAARQAEALTDLEQLGAFERFRQLFSESKDYGYSIPIGLEGESKPVFTIQVLVSNVLLRDALGPGLRRIALVAAAALVLSLGLVYAVAAYTTSNLKRIGMRIDRIGQERGSEVSVPEPEPAAAEFAAVGSKLNLLDNRVRDAIHDAEEYRNRVSAMLESLEEAILLFDDDRLVLAAGPIRSLLGASVNQIVNRPRGDVLPLTTELGEVAETAFAARGRLHDQTVRWTGGTRERRLVVNLDFIVTGPDDTRATALMRLRDAEGAGEVESQLKLSTRLEAINRLTGGVAHEIKNPLNAISARLALLESIVDEAPDATHQIRTISGEIERLDRVVRTFLDFTRPLELAREQVDLAVLARETAHMLEPDATRRKVALEFDGAHELLPVCGDRDLLKQAMLNIAVNGLEAMTAGGRLRIRCMKAAGVARVSVSDTGPGIAPEQLAEIFRLYYTTKKGGSGIGLAVSYRTLQLHGGELYVESEPGKGSTFHLSLPIVRLEEAVEKDVAEHIAAGAGTPL
jgi:signal transduction histidine kinase